MERSPLAYNSTAFCGVLSSGFASNNSASASNGVCFGSSAGNFMMMLNPSGKEPVKFIELAKSLLIKTRKICLTLSEKEILLSGASIQSLAHDILVEVVKANSTFPVYKEEVMARRLSFNKAIGLLTSLDMEADILFETSDIPEDLYREWKELIKNELKLLVYVRNKDKERYKDLLRKTQET